MAATERLEEQDRRLLRPVALTYRRAKRAGIHEGEATDMAIREYQRLNPNAPANKLSASRIVIQMIAMAISADTEWFWHGPDA